MSYATLEFILFIVAITVLYATLSTVSGRKYFLILASALFLSWTGFFNFLVFFLTVAFSWFCVFADHSSRKRGKRRPWIIMGGIAILVLNFSYWKYFASAQRFPVPLGLSFSLLQAIAYLVDYDRDQAELMPFSDYLLFRGLFCQLIAGPIVRARELLPQIKTLEKIAVENLMTGVSLFLLGFGKKLLIADRMSLVVDPVFTSPLNYSAHLRVIAAIAYAVQIWADFSGYTDMARGAARIFGIVLPENFIAPYFSSSLSEFWSRWHITFTLWVKEFLFLPLALLFGRVSSWAIFGALLIATTLSGLWHGGSATFALWGLYHGIALGLEHGLRKIGFSRFIPRILLKSMQCLLTFFVVCVGLIIFRSDDLRSLQLYFSAGMSDLQIESHLLSAVAASVLGCVFLHIFSYFDFSSQMLELKSTIQNTPSFRLSVIGAFFGLAALAVFCVSVFFHPAHTSDSFIYFQF